MCVCFGRACEACLEGGLDRSPGFAVRGREAESEGLMISSQSLSGSENSWGVRVSSWPVIGKSWGES